MLKQTERVMIISFFAWLAFCCFFGEYIPEHNGIGFDGMFYAQLAKNFPTFVFDNQLPIYSIQHILPSGIIYYATHLINFFPAMAQMPFIFSIYNMLILGLGVYLWYKIANFLQWNLSVIIIGFCGLFLNYAILKMNTYYPVLTDTSAFVCSLLMLYFYLTQRTFSLLLTSVAGAFIFPTLLYQGLLLFIFVKPKQHSVFSIKYSSDWIGTLIALMIASLLTLGIGLIYKNLGVRDDFALGRFDKTPVIYLSLFAALVYLFLAFNPICQQLKQTLMRVLEQLINYRLLTSIAVAFVVRLIIHSLSSGGVGPLTPFLFIELISIRSLAYPAIFLVSNFIYYGPIICLIAYFWNDIIYYLKSRSNVGLFVLTVFSVIFAINTEARQSINYLPFAVMIICEVLNTRLISTKFVITFLITSLMLSRVWLPLSHGWSSLLTNPPQITLDFPMQWYFMSQGPWMSKFMYLIFLPICILTSYFIYLLAKPLKAL